MSDNKNQARSLLSLIIFVVIGYSIYSSLTKTSNGPSETTTTVGQQSVYLGSAAPDGQLTFTASGVVCGFTTVGSDGFGGVGATAQGVYCKVHVVILNHSTSSATYFASNQFAYDERGRKFTADDTADTYGNSNGGMSGTSINPGNSINGFVFYDIPRGDSITAFEFHDSTFSGGVLVTNQ